MSIQRSDHRYVRMENGRRVSEWSIQVGHADGGALQLMRTRWVFDGENHEEETEVLDPAIITLCHGDYSVEEVEKAIAAFRSAH